LLNDGTWTGPRPPLPGGRGTGAGPRTSPASIAVSVENFMRIDAGVATTAPRGTALPHGDVNQPLFGSDGAKPWTRPQETGVAPAQLPTPGLGRRRRYE